MIKNTAIFDAGLQKALAYFYETHHKTFVAWFRRENDHLKASQLAFSLNSPNKPKIEFFMSNF